MLKNNIDKYFIFNSVLEKALRLSKKDFERDGIDKLFMTDLFHNFREVKEETIYKDMLGLFHN